MKLQRWVAAGAIALALILPVGLVGGGFWQQREQQQRACEAGNDTRKALTQLFDDLRPASEIRRPGETDEQYTFRLEQAAQSYEVLHARLAPRQC